MPKRPLLPWTAILATLIAVLAIPSSRPTQASDAACAPPAQAMVVRVFYTDQSQRNQLLLSFEAQLLETVDEARYHVMQLTPSEIEQLTRAGFRVQPDPDWQPPPLPESTASTVQAGSIPGYPCYRTVEETYAAAQQIVHDHPRLAAWQDIGDSWEKSARLGGYDIMALVLTNQNVPGPKPVLLLNAAIHAREYATAELVTRFAESLVEGYGRDPDATWILDYHEVHAILHANPDGRKQAEAGHLWRKNTNQAYCVERTRHRGVDLNRNFDFQWNCCGGSSGEECNWNYRGPAPASEPETQALQDYMAQLFADQRGPDLHDAAPDDASGVYIDVHSYGELVLWSWGFSYEAAPNATQLQTLGRKLAYWNHYTPQPGIGLYPADGTSDDYAYGQLGMAAYTLELGTAFFQDCATFEETILPSNLPVLRYAAKVARTPYLTPSGPDSQQLSLSAQAFPPGATVTLTATIDDTRYETSEGSEPVQAIAAAEWSVDTPPWQAGASAEPMQAADGAWDSSREETEAVIDTAGWSTGRHILYVRGQDAGGNWGATSALFVSVSRDTNDVPVAAFDYRCRANACQFDASGSFDRDGEIVSYAWTLGDGSTTLGRTVDHRYVEGGRYRVVLTITDDDGASGAQARDIATDDGQQHLYLPLIYLHGTDR